MDLLPKWAKYMHCTVCTCLPFISCCCLPFILFRGWSYLYRGSLSSKCMAQDSIVTCVWEVGTEFKFPNFKALTGSSIIIALSKFQIIPICITKYCFNRRCFNPRGINTFRWTRLQYNEEWSVLWNNFSAPSPFQRSTSSRGLISPMTNFSWSVSLVFDQDKSCLLVSFAEFHSIFRFGDFSATFLISEPGLQSGQILPPCHFCRVSFNL